MLLAPGQAEPHFWVLCEAYAGRVSDGLVYPDAIAAGDCRIVEADIPAGWVMRMGADGSSDGAWSALPWPRRRAAWRALRWR